LEKTPLPWEVVLPEGMDHHLLCCFPCTTLAFLPVVEEEFLVVDLLRYSRALQHRASFWMRLRSSDSTLPIKNLDINLHGLWCFTNKIILFF
jgi:hypothetical protein